MADQENDDYNPASELGRSGLPFYAGYVQAETLLPLVGHRKRKVYQEMYSDTTLGAMRFGLEHLMRQVKFTFVAADDSPKALEYRDFYEAALFQDMKRTWRDTLAEISTFLWWGFAPLELVYKRRMGMNPGSFIDEAGIKRQRPQSKFSEGLWGWDYWPLRGQATIEKWDFDIHGDATKMWQLSPPDWKWIDIPMEFILNFRTTLTNNNPEGESLFRNAYISWFYRTNYQRFEGIGVERYLAGYPMFRIPAEIINAARGSSQYKVLQNFQKIVTNIRRDEQMGLLIPSDRDANGNALYEFSFINAGSATTMDMEPKIQRLDQRMLMSVMMDFLLLGHQKVGSFALADSKTELFITALGSFLDTICDVINRCAVPRLGDLNAFQPELLPQLHHGDIETQDLGVLGDYVAKLTSAGALVFPTEDGQLEDHLKRQASFPVSEHQDQQDKPEKKEPEKKPVAGRVPENKNKPVEKEEPEDEDDEG